MNTGLLIVLVSLSALVLAGGILIGIRRFSVGESHSAEGEPVPPEGEAGSPEPAASEPEQTSW